MSSKPAEAKIPAAYQERWEKDNNSIVFFPLAEAYRKAGQIERAIQLCRHGLNIHPYYWGARVVLARVYLEQDKLDEAKTELEKVVEIVPFNLLAAKLLAQVYTRQGELAKALQRYRLIGAFYPEVTKLAGQIDYILETELPRKKKLLQILEQWREAVIKTYPPPEQKT